MAAATSSNGKKWVRARTTAGEGGAEVALEQILAPPPRQSRYGGQPLQANPSAASLVDLCTSSQ
ncbi:hypothetical protein E2562_039541 [Oryza meyeriana var. granulata]|uniref:Uncharacterized protein n=1 Tax=Oryza meyeriana var. granulata TaxID=110450 RepID=A0A6G1ECS7_9ORYZ|nr:hypothetical protein E2562_039541 [Oryza meyeriana var. granulata]